MCIETIENAMGYFIISYGNINVHRASWRVEIHTVVDGKKVAYYNQGLLELRDMLDII